MDINTFAMKHKTIKSILHDFKENASYVGPHLASRYKDSNAVFSENSFLCGNYIHHKEHTVKVLHRYT